VHPSKEQKDRHWVSSQGLQLLRHKQVVHIKLTFGLPDGLALLLYNQNDQIPAMGICSIERTRTPASCLLEA
jgi:hypothetical protein